MGKREKGGFWIAFCAIFFYPTGWLVARTRYQGLSHIPATGGALVVANHISHLDPIYSGKAFAGLLALAERGEIGGKVLFWHTGGIPTLFAR